MLINCEKIEKKIKEEVIEYIETLGVSPTLALIRVEGDDASKVYVNNKIKACESVGIKSVVVELPNETTEDKLAMEINKLNEDDNINGILVQLPLPDHINEQVVNLIHPLKDVDCLSYSSVGRLFRGEEIAAPCTPAGIMRVVKETVGCISGNRVLVINRSMLVGKPLVELMQRENATVTLAHSKTGKETLKALMAVSDIIVTAVGKANFITKETIEEYEPIRKALSLPPQIFIDVSMNRDENKKLCGDISKDLYDNDSIHVTPVPKGIGLTTVASLLRNTTLLAYSQKEFK